MGDEVKLALVGLAGSVATILLRDGLPKMLTYLRTTSAQRLHEERLNAEASQKGWAEVIRRIDWEREQDKAECEKEIAELKQQRKDDLAENQTLRKENQEYQKQIDKLTWQSGLQQSRIKELEDQVAELKTRLGIVK
jgi:chromosome segregation ATPase